MLEKYALKVSKQTNDEEQMEQKKFGKYTVNYYKKANNSPIFYISK